MSHEIRTPINAIMGYADLLETEVQGDLSDGQRSFVNRIKASGFHLASVVSEILDLSKIEAGGMTVGLERVSVRETVQEALDLVLPQARAKHIDVIGTYHCDPETAVYLGDPDRVRQIVLNLLSNAVKFTEADGSVECACDTADEPVPGLEVEGSGPWIRVDVKDSGIGFEPGQITRIFEPFVQVDDAHTRRQGGTGLGLTISRKLARMMGGDLTVQSRPGEGSVFSLWLPNPSAGVPASATAENAEYNPRKRGAVQPS